MAETPGWKRRLAELLGADEPPARVAGSFAAGVFCGTAPLFLGVLLAYPLLRWLRLSPFVGLGVTALFAANPFGLFVVAGQTWLGLLLLGKPVPEWRALMDAFRAVAPLLWRGAGEPAVPGAGAAWDLLWGFLLGGTLGSLAASAAAFVIVRAWLESRRSLRARSG